MLKIKPPPYKFCPFCGQKLKNKDEEGETRKFCSCCNWTYYPHVGTTAAGVILKRNKVLLVKRNRSPYKDTWMLPAGFVEYGEHPEETLVREIKEETGLKTKPAKLMTVLQIEDDPRSPGHFCFFYLVKIISGKIRISDEDENSEIGWFSLDDLPLVGWKSHKKILKIKSFINVDLNKY